MTDFLAFCHRIPATRGIAARFVPRTQREQQPGAAATA